MWIAKIRYKHADCVTAPKAVAHGIEVFATPGNSYTHGKFIYNTGFLMLRGPEKGKKGFIKDLKKDKTVAKVEVNNDLVVFIEKRPCEKKEYSSFRSKEVMVVKPVYCDPRDGQEYWEVCSWDKKHIKQFIEDLRKIGTAHLLGIQKMKLQDIYHFRISPRLTNRQREAFELAMKKGWYEVPRKVDLDELAQYMKISRQAFSEHLRKAEASLIPRLGDGFLE